MGHWHFTDRDASAYHILMVLEAEGTPIQGGIKLRRKSAPCDAFSCQSPGRGPTRAFRICTRLTISIILL